MPEEIKSQVFKNRKDLLRKEKSYINTFLKEIWLTNILIEQTHHFVAVNILCENVTSSEVNDKWPLLGFHVLQQNLDYLEKASGGTLSLFTIKFETVWNCCNSLIIWQFMQTN